MILDRTLNIIAAIGISVGGWTLLGKALPASMWMTVENVFVYDSEYGKVPSLEVVRTIHRPFIGQYTIIVRRADTLEVVCSYPSGEILYEPQAPLPTPLLMNWWADGSPSCSGSNWPPGIYIMRTRWNIERPFLPDTRVEFTSRPFTISGKQQ